MCFARTSTCCMSSLAFCGEVDKVICSISTASEKLRIWTGFFFLILKEFRRPLDIVRNRNGEDGGPPPCCFCSYLTRLAMFFLRAVPCNEQRNKYKKDKAQTVGIPSYTAPQWTLPSIKSAFNTPNGAGGAQL